MYHDFVNYLILFFAHASYWIRCVDVIDLVVAIFDAEMTRVGTLKRDVLICDMQYVLQPNYILAFILHIFSCIIDVVTI